MVWWLPCPAQHQAALKAEPYFPLPCVSSPTAAPQPLVAAQPLQAPRQMAGSSPRGLLQLIAERITFTIFMCRSTGHDGRGDEKLIPGSAQKPC